MLSDLVLSSSLRLMVCISLVLASFAMLAVIQIAFAGDELTVESKTSVQNLNHPIKLKVIASANGDTKAKKTTLYLNPVRDQ